MTYFTTLCSPLQPNNNNNTTGARGTNSSMRSFCDFTLCCFLMALVPWTPRLPWPLLLLLPPLQTIRRRRLWTLLPPTAAPPSSSTTADDSTSPTVDSASTTGRSSFLRKRKGRLLHKIYFFPHTLRRNQSSNKGSFASRSTNLCSSSQPNWLAK